MGEQELKFVGKQMRAQRYTRDTVLVEQDDPSGDTMFMVVEGFVALYTTLPPTASGHRHRFVLSPPH